MYVDLYLIIIIIIIIVVVIIIVIIIIGSSALGGPWPPQANVTCDLYPGHPPANFYNQFPCVFLYPVNPS